MTNRMTCCTAALMAVVGTGLVEPAGATAAEGIYLRLDAGGSLSQNMGKSVVDGTGFQGDLGSGALVGFGVGYQLPQNLRVDLTAAVRPGEKIRSRESVFDLPVTADADLT
ncbi:hypothetical protein, partial [Telmatospirillum sp.]|uniref:hypothetical protein n=1 Tax=Telmatospirillum sp. TaxID=2079197 RepID=UPI00284E6227